jgi:hypothetical protein
MNRTAAEEVRLVAYFGKTPDLDLSEKSRYEWELAGDDAATAAAEAALVDNLRKRIFGAKTVGLVLRIPLFGKSPVSFSGVTMKDLAKKLQGEVSNLVAPSGGSRTISHPNPTNLPEAPQGTMLREFAPDPDSLTSRATKLAATLPHGSLLRRVLVASVKSACPGHLGNPMQVPPNLSRASAPGVACGTCMHFCPTRNVCKAFGDYPVSADMVCSAWEGEVEAPEFGTFVASAKKVAKGTPRSFMERNPTAQVEVMADAGITVIRYSGAKSGKPAAAVYSGKSENPLWDYFFGSESAREQYIADQVEKSKAAMSARQERAQAKRDFQHGMKDGDILYSSWGYDQTNINFYEVVGVVGKQVIVREVESKVVRQERGADYVVAVPGRFTSRSKPLKKIPQKGYRDQPYIKISPSQNAYPWDGKPKYETASGFGH